MPDADPPPTVLRVPGVERPLTLHGGPSERSLLDRIAATDGRYEGGVMRLLGRLLEPGDVVLDAGAHIGIISLAVAAAVPGVRVHAMEAFPGTADVLEANLAANGLAGAVTVHRTAIAERSGPLRFAGNTGFSAGAHVDAGGDAEVPGVALDDWADATGIDRLDLLKADVEGSEFALLEGGARTIARLRPAIVMEVNPAALRRVDGRGPRELWRLLTRHHPFVSWVGRGGAPVPLRGEDDLMARLRRHGLGDVLCTAGRPPRGDLRALAGRLLERLPHRGSEYAVEAPLRVRAISPPPARMRPGTRELLPVEVTNGTGSLLSGGGPCPVRAAARWWDASGAQVADGGRAELGAPLPPGGTRRMAVELVAPDAPGEYAVAVALVQEHFAWLDDLGPESAVRFTVTVTA
ncbi:MAG: FkbM family methyltransferase [Thermoleophilia bacterium]|nr:FkbM family methyltransferase [Thermoleophilia bacterium]